MSNDEKSILESAVDLGSRFFADPARTLLELGDEALGNKPQEAITTQGETVVETAAPRKPLTLVQGGAACDTQPAPAPEGANE